jgi:Tol biopolymer transport system component
MAGSPAPPRPAPVMRFALPLPAGLTLYRDAVLRPSLALSPDGGTVAAVLRDRSGVSRAYLRPFGGAAFAVVPGSEETQRVFWSPDGARLGLTAGTQVRSVDRSGLNSQSLFTAPGPPTPPFWAANGDIFVQAQGTVHRWSPGGPVGPIVDIPAGQPNRPLMPFPLADGRLLHVQGSPHPNRGEIVLRDAGGTSRTVVEVESSFVPAVQYHDGYLLIAHSPNDQPSITAQRFDPVAGTLSGPRVTLAAGASMLFTASPSALVYANASSALERFFWVDERGATLSSLEGDISIFNFDLSADGRMVVLEQRPTGLSVRDLARGVTSRLSAEGVDPVWSRDGSQVAYAVPGKRTVHVISPFGGPSRQIFQSDVPVYLDDWSRDGRWVAGHTMATGPGILIPVGHDAKPIAFKHDDLGVDETRFSPDGRWLAYGAVGVQGAQSQVFVIDLPPSGARWQVSVNGGAQPRWRDDGKALYFLSTSGTMMMVDVTLRAGAPPQFSAPRGLFETGLGVTGNVDQYAVGADGSRFLLRRSVDQRPQDDPQVVLNWQTLLKEER